MVKTEIKIHWTSIESNHTLQLGKDQSAFCVINAHCPGQDSILKQLLEWSSSFHSLFPTGWFQPSEETVQEQMTSSERTRHITNANGNNSQQMPRDSYSCDLVLLEYWGRNKHDVSLCSAIFHWVILIMSFWCYSFSKSYCSDCTAGSVLQSWCWFACVWSFNYCSIFLLCSFPYLWHSSLDRSNRVWVKTKAVWKSERKEDIW